MKRKVKILVESVAGLGDAQPDAPAGKYAGTERAIWLPTCLTSI